MSGWVVFFLATTLFFFQCPYSRADTPEKEIAELKTRLKAATDRISELTERLSALEKKVSFSGEKESLPEGGESAGRTEDDTSGPGSDEVRMHDLATAHMFSSGTSDEIRDSRGEITGTSRTLREEIREFYGGVPESRLEHIESVGAHTTDKVRELAQKFKYFPEGFEFHGYLRSGFGADSKGGQQVAFQAPGAPSKYRLGNETETYGELLFTQNFNPEELSPFFNVNVRLAFKTLEQNGSDPANDEFSVKEAYAEMGNFDWLPGAKFWAGERFYRRQDIYIIDYYFLDMSGYGGGVEDININDWAKLSAAWIGGGNDEIRLENVGNITKNSFDIRLYDIDVPFGKGTIWLDPSFIKGGSYRDADSVSQEYNSAWGFAAGFIHTMRKPLGMPGYNKFSAQYGAGSSSDFTANVQDHGTKIQGRRQLQITDAGVIRPLEDLALMYTFVYKGYDNGLDNDNREDWFSAGTRPVYFFNKHVALALEAGIDHVNSERHNYDDTLFKVSLAPELRIDSTFLGRPVLRAYVTYAAWGNDFKGRVGGSTYADDTHGLAFGVQMEAWW